MHTQQLNVAQKILACSIKADIIKLQLFFIINY